VGVDPAAHASSRRAVQDAGNGTAGVKVIRHGQTSDTETSREFAVRRSLITVADAHVEGEVGTNPPIVLEIEAVVGVDRKIGLSLLVITVAGDVSEHDIRQRD